MSILGAIQSKACNVRFHHNDKPSYFFLSACTWISHKLLNEHTKLIMKSITISVRNFSSSFIHITWKMFITWNTGNIQPEIIFYLIRAMKVLSYQPQITYDVFKENTDLNWYNTVSILYNCTIHSSWCNNKTKWLFQINAKLLQLFEWCMMTNNFIYGPTYNSWKENV